MSCPWHAAGSPMAISSSGLCTRSAWGWLGIASAASPAGSQMRASTCTMAMGAAVLACSCRLLIAPTQQQEREGSLVWVEWQCVCLHCMAMEVAAQGCSCRQQLAAGQNWSTSEASRNVGKLRGGFLASWQRAACCTCLLRQAADGSCARAAVEVHTKTSMRVCMLYAAAV